MKPSEQRAALCTAILLTAAVLFGNGCRACRASNIEPSPVQVSSPPPPKVRLCPARVKYAGPPSPDSLKQLTDRAHIYFDTSASIRGFAAGPGRVHCRLLESLRDVLDQAHIRDFEASDVAGSLTNQGRIAGFSKYCSPKMYTGKESYLPKPFEDALTPTGTGLMLVLTDGVVSIRAPQQSPGQSSVSQCAQGADETCLSSMMGKYVSAGHAFWIVGIRLPFQGTYYVEEPGPDPRQRVIRNAKVPDRPFYLWIGASSVDQGRKVIAGLLDFANQQNPKLGRLIVEVSPGSWYGWVPDSATTDLTSTEQTDCLNGDLLDGIGHTDGIAVVRAEVAGRSNRPGTKTQSALGFALPAHTAFFTSSGDSLVEVRQSLRPDRVGASLESQILAPNKGQRSRRLDLCLKLGDRLARERAGRIFPVCSDWKVAASADSAVWGGWSTDTDWQRATLNRTLHLDILLKDLQAELVGPPGTVQTFVTTLLDVSYGGNR